MGKSKRRWRDDAETMMERPRRDGRKTDESIYTVGRARDRARWGRRLPSPSLVPRGSVKDTEDPRRSAFATREGCVQFYGCAYRIHGLCFREF